MSNRFITEKKNDYRNSSKPQKKFVPKSDIKNPNPPQTLSNSFRSATGVDVPVASTSRVALGENGQLRASGNFLIYLPQDEAVAAGLGPEAGGLDPQESQQVVDFLNKGLSRLLKLPPKEFWREVATDESLHAFLESFLKFKSRWYDFPYRGAQGIVAGVIVGEIELCRRVFMVLYRLSSNRDPGAKATDVLSQKDHAALLQDKRLLDLPKLLDICAIYGHENEDMTRILVMNAMKEQPFIKNDFSPLMSHFISIFQTMYERCNSTLEVLLSSGQYQGSSRLHLDYLEVMDFINDAVVSMDSFVNAYKHAAVFFSSPVEMSHGSEELLTILGKLHDSLLPSLQKGFHIIFATTEDNRQDMSSEMLSNVLISLKMLSARIARFSWRLLDLCYLSDEVFEGGGSLPVTLKMFPATVEDPVIRADILIQSIRDLCGGHGHIPMAETWRTLIQNIEKNHKIMSRIELLQQTGWISMDNEQFQFLAAIMTHPLETDIKLESTASFPVSSNDMQKDEDSAIMESKISQIKELFPDYGRGFIVACLEAYNHDAEEVIQRILEGTLHEELQSLDISLDRMPPPKSTTSVSKLDKGKGKLVDSAMPPPDTRPTVTKNQAGISSSSSSSLVGRFIRKNTDDLPDFKTLNAQKEKELEKTAALASQLEYEDEYDDSFDDLGLSVQDYGLDEPESLADKLKSQRGRSNEADGGSSTSNSENSKWNSRKKPQFYVKDGKNYSYKVDGSVAVGNYNEAKLVNLAQKELVHGLGRGGNLPLGAVQKLTESNKEQDDRQESDDVGGRGSFRGRGRRGFHSGTARRPQEPNDEGDDGQDTDEVGGRGGRGNTRGGSGRRGRGRSQHFRRDQAMRKHLSGLPGHYNS